MGHVRERTCFMKRWPGDFAWPSPSVRSVTVTGQRSKQTGWRPRISVPVVAPDAEALWPWALQDKKNDEDQVNMVLLHGLGTRSRSSGFLRRIRGGHPAAESMG